MRALGGIADKTAVDQRAQSSGKSSAGRPETSKVPSAFDGVLADAGSPKASTTAALVTLDKSASALASVDSQLDRVGNKLAGGSTKDGAGADPSVDSLLKRMTARAAGKETDGNPVAGTENDASATAAGANLAALVLGAGAAAAAAALPPGGGLSAKPAKTVPTDRTAPLQSAATESGAAPALANVSIATHLTPSSEPDAKSAAASTPAEQKDDGSTTDADAAVAQIAVTGAGSAHGDGSPSGHQRDPDRGADAAPTVGRKDGLESTPGIDGLPAATVTSPVQKLAATLKTVAARAAASTPDPGATRVAPARTLTLQISPADLGTVDVRMHMAGAGLDIQLKIADPKTLGAVTRERETLEAALQSQHYELHSLVIQDGGAAAQPGDHHASQGSSAGANPSGGEARSDGRSDDGSGRRDRDDRSSRDDRSAARSPAGPSSTYAGGRALLV